MEQNMNLHVDVTADSAQAVTSVDTLNSRLSALEQAFIRSGGGASHASSGFTKVGTAAQESGNLITRFTEDVSKHTRTVGIALNTMGLHAEAAAAKMDGLTQLFMGMGGAVPGLLAVATGITGIFTAFEGAKDAINAAADWQQRMALLGQTVRNQGGDWNTLASSVQAWADVQEKTTAFSRDDAVSALETLTATGMKLNDAMIVTRVAEDAAAATGRSLTEVNFSLSEAMHGRTQALTQLGIGTKQQIKDGMKFADILKIIEKNMGGEAAAAADTWKGELTQLHNVINTLLENIGIRLLPYMQQFVDRVKDWVDEADRALPDIEQKFLGVYNAAKSVLDFLKAHQAEVDFFFGTVIAVTAVKALTSARQAFIDFRASMITSATWTAITSSVQEAALVFGLNGGGLVGGLRAATVAFKGLQVAEAGATLGLSLFIGWLVDGHFQQAVDVATAGISKIVGALGALVRSLGEATNNPALLAVGEKIDAWNIVASTPIKGGGAVKPFDWASMWGNHSSDSGIGDLSSGLADEMAGGKIGSGLHHIKKAAHAARQSVQKLQKALEDLYAIGNPFGKLLHNPLASNSATAGLLSHTDSIETSQMGAQISAAMKQQQDMQRQLRMWEQYYKTLEQNAQQWTNKTATWIEEMFAHGKKGVNSFEKTFKDMLKSLEEALLKSALFELFMGAQGAKGPSFGSLVAQYMGFGSKGNSGGQMQTNGSGGIIGGLIGTSASSQLASSLPTDSLMSLMFGVGAPSTVGGMGGSAGVGGMLAGASMVSASPNGPGGGTMAGGYGSILANNSGTISAFLGTPAGQAAAGIAIAAGFGDAFAALIHGGNNDGSTYGLWGMIGGALLGIPGAIVGSLFGHKDNPANMPDKYNTQDFGQIVANLTGAGGAQYHSTDPTAPASHNWFGANGQKFYSNIGSLTGGGSGIGWIEETLAQYANPDGTMKSNAPSWLAPMWNQLVAAFGISATGSGQLNFGHNIGQEWVTGAQGASSNPTSYSQLGDLMNQFIQNYLTQGNVTSSPYTNPTNNGSGFNVSSPFAGAYIVGTPGSAPVAVTGQSGVPAFPTNDLSGATPNITTSRTMLASGVGNGLAAGVGQGINIVVNVAGNVTAEQDLRNAIRESIIENIVSHKFSNDMALGGVGF